LETIASLSIINEEDKTYSWRSRLWTYMEVGRLLHFITLFTGVIAIITYRAMMTAYFSNDLLSFIIYGSLFLHFVSLPFFAQFDARSRFQNYKMVCDLFYKYGYRERFIKALKHSKCQREAAYIAAKNLSYKDEVKNFFYESGYRWYHLVPDFIWKHPGYLFSKHFWLTTFFTKTYIPKYYRH
jgi:hypothetical protein